MIDDAFVEGFGHHIIRLLRTEREKRGISMNQLAHESGLAQSTVSRVENELRIPSLDTLLRIAAVIDVKIEDVIADARRVASKKR